jgi:uncharacterized RDD family membrane protein YckC
MTAREISSGYDSSIVVSRWAGAWIDFIALALLFLVPNLLLGDAVYRSTVLIWVALAVLYFPVLEGLKGWSLGKLVTRTRVVDESGHVPGVGKAVIRTFARLFEVNPLLLGGIPAGIAVLASRTRQRVGDMMAKTYVIRARDLAKLQPAAAAPSGE